MLTEFQKKNFEKNRTAYIYFTTTLEYLKGGSEVEIDFLIEFFNKMNSLKIDLVSSLPDKFFEKIHFMWAECVVTEMLQMEFPDMEKFFFEKDSIEFDRDDEIDNFKNFLSTLNYHENSDEVISRYYQKRNEIVQNI